MPVKEISAALQDLPGPVQRVLEDFVGAASSALGGGLRSIVLYGSGAEGKLRATSDVNVMLVLRDFKPERADGLREPLRTAQAAIRLRAMFLLESEVPEAVESFAQKFADLVRRHRVLYGDDPLAGVKIPRPAEIFRLRQVLLNLTLRLRSMYMSRGLREEQLAAVVADAAGPLRSCAATLLELEGRPAPSPKEALAEVAGALSREGTRELLAQISEAREKSVLPAGVAADALLHMIELARYLRERAEKLA